MSKFIPGSSSFAERQKQQLRRKNIEKIEEIICEGVRDKLVESDSTETIEECLGMLIDKGFSEPHAADFIQRTLTEKFSGKLKRNEKIEETTGDSPQQGEK